MSKKSNLAFFLVILISLVPQHALAKVKRGDDLVVYFFPRPAQLPGRMGLWAIISNNVAPTLTRIPYENCPTGLMGIACNFRNDQLRLFEKKQSNQRWVFLNKTTLGYIEPMPNYIVGADTNGDGKDELVASYNDGTYVISNVHTGTPRWTKILNVGRDADPADLNGNGKADMIFSTLPGIQARMDNGQWIKLTNEAVRGFWPINFDGK